MRGRAKASREGPSRGQGAFLAPVLALTLLTSCDEARQPPAAFSFEGLPVAGSIADAQRAGFTNCVSHNIDMRCRKEGVSLKRHGPFSAAVDLQGGGGEGGFDHLILWNPSDQSALVAITTQLRGEGWSECLTPVGDAWKGQAIYQRKGAPIFYSLDLTYWDRRTLKLYPAAPAKIPACQAAPR
ncbi:hypothetical protein [Sphingomonas humi]|uniref:Lipoprotein n=1 Tax=Sphingomonas humi TaxID=335630 RepID=A0ABP7RG29_9SPHN